MITVKDYGVNSLHSQEVDHEKESNAFRLPPISFRGKIESTQNYDSN